MNTYEVIPYRYLENAEGKRASIYGAVPPGYVAKTNGFTVRVTSSQGNVTTGLNCLKTPATHAEAARAAIKAASATNGKYIPSN